MEANAADITTAIGTVALAVTGIVALIFAARQLREFREAEKVKHLIELNSEFDREPIVSWRKDVAEQRLKEVGLPDEAWNIINFFETIALLERRGYLDVNDVWSMFSYWMFHVYADFGTDIASQQGGGTIYYVDFCNLIEKLRLIERAKGGEVDRPSREKIKEFWESEKWIMAGSSTGRRTKPKITFL